MTAPIGNKNAQVHIDWSKVDELAKINCTEEEVSAVLGVSVDTLSRRCKEEKGCLFAEYLKKGCTNFKVSLRRVQARSAMGVPRNDENGNFVDWIIRPDTTMQIWLGKQYLGQSDKVEEHNDTSLTIKHLYPKPQRACCENKQENTGQESGDGAEKR